MVVSSLRVTSLVGRGCILVAEDRCSIDPRRQLGDERLELVDTLESSVVIPDEEVWKRLWKA